MKRRGVLVACLVVLLCAAITPVFASNRLYSFPLDSDPGWTRGTEWDFGSGDNCCSEGAFTGVNVFAISLGGAYPTGMGTQYLTTGAFDCSGATEVYLRFWRWLGYAEDTYAAVWVSTDGVAWTDVWVRPDLYHWDSEWTECVYDLSSVAAGQPTIYIRWVMTPTGICSCFGWTIDDVEIWDGVPEPPVLPQTIYFFPLDSDPGWTTEGDWAFGPPGGLGGDPASPYSGLNVYGYNLSGAYPNDMPAYSLTTTPLNCAGFKDVTVNFQRWLGVERDWYDQALFQVSDDGSGWTTVWENDSSDLQDVSWVPVEYDISAVADGQPTVYLRWVMGPSDFMVTYSGWNIDDIEISGMPATAILAWVPYADTGWEWPNTIAALDSKYTDYNLTETTTLDPVTLASELVGKHVFLVPEQESATGSDLQTAGAAFSDALWNFAERGGTVIVTGEYDEWSGFLTATGLLDSTYQTVYSMGEDLPVVEPGHPLANGLGATVVGMDATSAYSVGPEATVVVGDGSGNAIVAARQIAAGAVVVMGYDYWSWDDSAAILLANAVRYPRFSRQLLLYESSPYLHVGLEALNRLNQRAWLADDFDFNTMLASQSWNMVVGDVPNWVPQEAGNWQPFADWIGAGGYALLSTWNLENQTALAAAFGVSAGPNLDEVPPVYEWDTGPPLFDFREQVPTAITSWLDYYWDLGVDANRLTSTGPDTVEIAGFTVGPTTGEAAVVMGNGGRTLIDGFLWDDEYQDADGDGLQDATELVMNQILLILCVPLPDFSASVTSGNAPLSVDFTDETRAAVESWYWEFGDGGTSSEQNPSHTYLAEGLYTVTLTAANVNGQDMARKVDYIGVGAPPTTVAAFSATPTSGNAPLDVTFTDESTGALLSAWAWDFGDGGTSTEQNPTHQYTVAGNHTVSLTVTGFAGPDTETKTNYIAVGTAAGADFSGAPTEGVVTLDVTFTDLSTGDVVGWAWDFGDGGTSTVQNPSHEYTEPGRYTVTLVASDSYGSDAETKTDYIAVGFPDTPPDSFWAFDEVLDCVDAGVVAGYDDGLYHPDIQIDRAQMATYTARALAGGDSGVPDGPGTPTFPDVDTNFWAFKYVEYAVSQDVVQGYDDGYYHPEIVLDRGQMAVFIARAVAGDDASVPDGPATPTFPDVDTGFWSYKHIEYCVDQGIVGGYEDGLYHPEIPVTRDQMAVYVARALPLL
jgi:PKD repeat protein